MTDDIITLQLFVIAYIWLSLNACIAHGHCTHTSTFICVFCRM